MNKFEEELLNIYPNSRGINLKKPVMKGKKVWIVKEMLRRAMKFDHVNFMFEWPCIFDK